MLTERSRLNTSEILSNPVDEIRSGGLSVFTVGEGHARTALPEPIPFRAADLQTVFIEIQRRHQGGDPRLPVFLVEAMINRAA